MSTEYEKNNYAENLFAVKAGRTVELLSAVVFSMGLIIVMGNVSSEMNVIGDVVIAFGAINLCGGYLMTKYYGGKIKRKSFEEGGF